MKILKNFDAKKIAKAKNKILLAIVSILFLVLLLLSSAFREFVSKHPGLIGVLIAVSGEVYFDWKEESGRHAKWKKFFMALLVVSLAYELYEASESDQKAADSIKLAVQANLQVGVLSNATVQLSANLEEAKSNNLELARQVFGLAAQTVQISTNIAQVRNLVNSPEITAKLNEAKMSVAEANKTMADVKDILTSSNLNALSDLKPKSLKERIIDCLNSIDKKLIPRLASSSVSVPCSGEMPHETFSELKQLADESGAWKYLQIDNNIHGSAFMSDGTIVTTDIKFWIYAALLKKE